MGTPTENHSVAAPVRCAVLDQPHPGVIRGALGTVKQHDLAARRTSGKRLWMYLIVAATFGPPIVASAIIIHCADLEPYKRSRFGQYISRHTTPGAIAFRLAGALIMAVAAWAHQPIGLPVGLLVVLFAWARGLLVDMWAHGSDAPGRTR